VPRIDQTLGLLFVRVQLIAIIVIVFIIITISFNGSSYMGWCSATENVLVGHEKHT